MLFFCEKSIFEPQKSIKSSNLLLEPIKKAYFRALLYSKSKLYCLYRLTYTLNITGIISVEAPLFIKRDYRLSVGILVEPKEPIDTLGRFLTHVSMSCTVMGADQNKESFPYPALGALVYVIVPPKKQRTHFASMR